MNLDTSNLPVESIGREVGSIRPANRAELVHEYLAKQLRIARQWLENRAEKPLGKVQLPESSILKANLDVKVGQRLTEATRLM